MTAQAGTIPALTQYGSGALPLAGTEAFEIVNTTNATSAASYFMLITDAVGKAPSAMSNANMTTTDMITFYRPSTGVYYSGLIGNISIPAGNLPVAGATGELLSKLSGGNYDASWVTLGSLLTASTGLTTTGTTAVVVSIAAGGVGSTQLGSFAVQASNIATGVVGSTQIGTGAITSTQLSANSIFSTAVATAQIGSTQLGTFAVQALNIATGIVGSTQLGAASVYSSHLSAAAIFSTAIATGQVGSTQLGAFAVQASNIATGVVGSTQIGALAVFSTAIATGQVGSTQLGAFAVNSSKIATSSIVYLNLQNATGLSVLGNASTATATLAAISGTANQILVINPAATTVLWQSLSTTLDVAIGSTQGAVLYRNAASWVTLEPGTAGYMLQTIGTGNNPTWTGGRALLNTIACNQIGSAVDTTSFTSRYSEYILEFENVCAVSTALLTTSLNLQIATTGTSWIAANYVSNILMTVGVTSVALGTTSLVYLTGITATTCIGTSPLYGLNGTLTIRNPAGTVARKGIRGDVQYVTPGAIGTLTNANAHIYAFWDGGSNAITSINIAFQTGNIATGVIRIYGIS